MIGTDRFPLDSPSSWRKPQAYRQANAAWVRTLSRQKRHADPPPVHIESLNHQPLSDVRENADRTALRQRYHDPVRHARLLPADPIRQAVLTVLEHARVQALGSRFFPGVALNLNRHFLKSGPAISPSEMLEGLAFVRLGAKPMPSALVQRSLKWEDAFRCFCDLWKPLGGFIQNQETFALHVSAFLEHVPEIPDLTGTETSHLTEINPPEAIISEAVVSEDDIKDPVSHKGPMSDENGTDHEKPYAPYTTDFDRVITATDLFNAEERALYREQLDRELTPYRQMVSRMARRMIRQLMARQRRSWLFDQEEGILDARRLACLAANPFNTQIFMLEAKSPFPSTVVSLLIDNSGSMKGKPILIAALTTEILAAALERCGVKVEILGYTTRSWNGGRSRQRRLESGAPTHPGRLNELLHIIYKDAGTPWRRARHHLGAMLQPELLKENIDGEALLWAWRRLLARPEPRRILLVVCDGSPHDEATLSANAPGYLSRHLHSAIKTIESSPVQLGAIGIGHDVARYYHRAVFLREVEELGENLMRQLLEMLTPQPAGGNYGIFG